MLTSLHFETSHIIRYTVATVLPEMLIVKIFDGLVIDRHWQYKVGTQDHVSKNPDLIFLLYFLLSQSNHHNFPPNFGTILLHILCAFK